MPKQAKTNWENVREKILATPKDVLKKVIEVDGHTIYDPKRFLDDGLDAEIVNAFIKVHKTDRSDPKAMIFKAGRIVNSVEGLYGLYLLEYISRCFDVDSWKIGRGSRASHLAEQLIEKWG